MKEKMSDLIHLQDCDNRMKEIIDKKNGGPLRIAKLEDELDHAESKFQADDNKLASLKKNSLKIDQEIQELEDKIEKSNVKLSHIKSNKEYRAALKEIDDLKHTKFATEDKAIQIMEQTEELEEVCRSNKGKQVELREQFEKEKDAILKEIAALDEELSVLEKKRTEFIETIDQDLLGKYLHLRERKEGQAISPVIGGVCQICHMGIPPQKFNELIKGNALLTCTNCNRIIYWAEDEHYQGALDKY